MTYETSFAHFVNIIFSLSLFFNAMLFVPQALRIIRTKSAEGISLFTFIGFNIMQLFAVLHGYLEQDYILMTGFLLSFITCGVVTSLIFKYRKA